jgi:carboxypeptidase C (cathepsin A)
MFFFPSSVANVLYVEAPAGVGYSLSNDRADYTTGDAKTAADNLLAIQQFFLRFPALTKNEFFISAESYGGHYVPTLAADIVKSGSLPNFKGFLLGNPLTDMDENENWGQAGTLCGHSLASKPTCDTFAKHCLQPSGPTSSCPSAQNAVVMEAGGLDAYGLDYPVCGQSQEQKRLLHAIYQRRMLRGDVNPDFKAQLDLLAPGPYDPCLMDELTVYLNRADVRASLHVDPAVTVWESCSNKVHYNRSDVNAHMQPIYESLLKHGGLRMVIFSGDDDSVCATSGTQHWMYTLLPDVASNWRQWTYQSEEYGKQLGGYVTIFKAGISLVTVHGAGHMVSTYQPERGLAVLEDFLAGKYDLASLEEEKERELKEEEQQVVQAVKRAHRKA